MNRPERAGALLDEPSDLEEVAWAFHRDSEWWIECGFTTWAAAHEWVDAGFSPPAARHWVSKGWRCEDAAAVKNLTPTHLNLWEEHGYPPTVIAAWVHAGIRSAAEARQWMSQGVTRPEVAAWWREQHVFTHLYSTWRRNERSVLDITRWARAGVPSHRSATAWERRGFNPRQARPWVDLRINAAAAHRWTQRGYTPTDISTWADAFNVNPHQVALSDLNDLAKRGITAVNVHQIHARCGGQPTADIADLCDTVHVLGWDRVDALVAVGVDVVHTIERKPWSDRTAEHLRRYADHLVNPRRRTQPFPAWPAPTFRSPPPDDVIRQWWGNGYADGYWLQLIDHAARDGQTRAGWARVSTEATYTTEQLARTAWCMFLLNDVHHLRDANGDWSRDILKNMKAMTCNHVMVLRTHRGFIPDNYKTEHMS